jgi:threonine/homoserine/homoserine lactone efflux protein
MNLATLLTFASLTALLVMSPGPNGVLIARTVPTSGRGAGFANIAGFVAAFYIHGTLSILGISVLLMRSAELFTAVKFAGAAYLCWIGLKSLRDAWRRVARPVAVAPAKRARTLRWAFGEGFLTNGLNPKVSMFYLAAFPQFIHPGEGSVIDAYTLVTLHACINIAWFGTLVVLFGHLAGAMRGGAMQRIVKSVTGVVFIGFGAKLALLRAPA